jgi:hypothetical protein
MQEHTNGQWISEQPKDSKYFTPWILNSFGQLHLMDLSTLESLCHD